MDLEVIPVAVSIRASCVVASEVVVRIGDPETSWSLISVEQTPGSHRLHDKVVMNLVVSLDSVLDENVVALDSVNDVLLKPEVAGSVEREGSVEALVNRVTSNI